MKVLSALAVILTAFGAVGAEVIDFSVKALDGFGGDTGSVVTRCQTKKGAEYDPVTLTRDVNTLRDSGEFDEINADAISTDAGVKVVFYVKRKLRFRAPLVIEGSDALSESKIAKEAALKDGFLYGESELAAAAARVRLAYQKKYYTDAKVTPKAEVLSGNDATITLMVDEGKRNKVSEYVFEGTEHALDRGWLASSMPWKAESETEFDEAELHEAISDYPWWNPYGWFSDSPVTQDQLVQCCDKVAEVYRNHGYLDVEVTGPRAETSAPGKVRLVFTVKEGPMYRVGACSIAGVTKYPVDVVMEKSNLPEAGTIAGAKALEEAAQRVKIVVGSGDSGLADTRVEVKKIPSETSAEVVDLLFKVTEGVPVVINEIVIRGNDYTKDRVIRREIALGPGDRMLEDRADRSKKRLENLDYFQRVNYYLEATDLGKDENGAEYRNLVYEVAEKNTGSFMVGIGASSVDSVYLSAELSQNNFDLFAPSKLFRGAGQKGRIYAAWGPRYQSAEVGVVEPYFLDRMLELSVDAYRRLRWYDEFDLIRSGVMATLSYPVKFWPTWEPFGRLGFGLSGEYIEFDDVEKGTYYTKGGRAVSFEEEDHKYGEAIEPVIHVFWSRDARDNFRMPTRGYKARIFGDISPAGDNEYWRLGINYRHYWNVWKRYNHVLMANFRAETIDAITDDVPIYNRMFLGGPKSIRGIEYRNISPMVRKGSTYSGDWSPWGGQTLACCNLEYTIPIVKMFRVAVFSDFGSVGEDAFDIDLGDYFAWTVGIGLRLDIPMFPIRLDFATPIEKPSEAEEEIFSFTVGYDF